VKINVLVIFILWVTYRRSGTIFQQGDQGKKSSFVMYMTHSMKITSTADLQRT